MVLVVVVVAAAAVVVFSVSRIFGVARISEQDSFPVSTDIYPIQM